MSPQPDNEQKPPPSERGDLNASAGGGCAFIGLLGLGGVLYILGGWLVLTLASGNSKVGVAYLMAAFAAALGLSFSRAWRGMGIGILLALGATLLLIALCSGMRIGG